MPTFIAGKIAPRAGKASEVCAGAMPLMKSRDRTIEERARSLSLAARTKRSGQVSAIICVGMDTEEWPAPAGEESVTITTGAVELRLTNAHQATPTCRMGSVMPNVQTVIPSDNLSSAGRTVRTCSVKELSTLYGRVGSLKHGRVWSDVFLNNIITVVT